jgi:hypothetical protein
VLRTKFSCVLFVHRKQVYGWHIFKDNCNTKALLLTLLVPRAKLYRIK